MDLISSVEMVGWLYPVGSGQWLHVLMDVGDKWCLSGVHIGANTFSIFINGMDICKWHQAEWYSWPAWRKGCHSEAPGQAWRMAHGTSRCWPRLSAGAAPGPGQLLVHWVGDEGIQSSPIEKGVLVDWKVDTRQWCELTAQQANPLLGCIKSSVGSRSREGILPLLLSGTTLTGLLHLALEYSAQKRHGPFGMGPSSFLLPFCVPGKGHERDQVSGSPLLWGQADTVMADSPAEEKAPRRPYCAISTLESSFLVEYLIFCLVAITVLCFTFSVIIILITQMV